MLLRYPHLLFMKYLGKIDLLKVTVQFTTVTNFRQRK